MARILALLLTSVCCVSFSVSLPAQTTSPTVRPAGGGAYFQALVKEAKSRIREIGGDQLGVLQKATPTPVLVDVREDNEWDKGRIPGAIHVGRGVLEVNIESRIPQKRLQSSSTARAAGGRQSPRTSSRRWATQTSPRWRAAWRPTRPPACQWTSRLPQNNQGPVWAQDARKAEVTLPGACTIWPVRFSSRSEFRRCS